MKSRRVIELSASDVEELIRDLSLLIVSMDRIGSTYCDDPKRRAVEMHKYFSKIKAFKLLARSRAVLSVAYDSQSAKADVLRLEESAEKMPYWHPDK